MAVFPCRRLTKPSTLLLENARLKEQVKTLQDSVENMNGNFNDSQRISKDILKSTLRHDSPRLKEQVKLLQGTTWKKRLHDSQKMCEEILKVRMRQREKCSVLWSDCYNSKASLGIANNARVFNIELEYTEGKTLHGTKNMHHSNSIPLCANGKRLRPFRRRKC